MTLGKPGSWLVALLLIATPWLLAACSAPEPRRPPPEGVMQVAARLAAPPAQTVEVQVANLPPGRRIEQVVLIEPGGARYAAPDLVPVRATEGGLDSGPSVGVRVTGGSSSRIRPSLNLGWNITGGQPERDSRRIEARVPIPDPAAYRAEASNWRVELVFTELDGARRTLSFPIRQP